VKSSTATGTIATAESSAQACCGRFAPSPTGLLHQGSLITALASFLDARAQGGRWLIRLEDLDQPRNVAGAAQAIIVTLATLGLESDGPILRQSDRSAHYSAALQQLHAKGVAYRCSCSRSDITGIYSGHCRDLNISSHDAAWRLRLPDQPEICFQDRIQGAICRQTRQLGDPVIYRRDGIAAYQLAVVVDDAAQGITHVVRGADLLDSTPWQLCLVRALGLPEPAYAHIPLLTEADGSKLAKSRSSIPLDSSAPGKMLFQSLALLQQAPPAELQSARPQEILDWAVAHWQPEQLSGITSLSVQR
jgi:glutamyl-Q tRNA(Asp) synthetase